MEKHYAFLKNNRVVNIAVFAAQDEELADRVAQEQGYDDAVWVNENPPALYSTWDGVVFTPPTLDDLYTMGIVSENSAMVEARLAALAKQEVTPTPASEG